MKPRVVHEGEVHRQHVRLEVPIRVEIAGARYRVDDWSVGGFGVEDVAAPCQPGERFRVRVVFPFEGFELAARVDAEMVYVDADRQRFGCRFAALTAEQLELFRYVADSYRSGRIATADDLLHVSARGDAAEAGQARGEAAGDQDRGGPAAPPAVAVAAAAADVVAARQAPYGRAAADEGTPGWRRRAAGYAALAVVGLVLVALAVAMGALDRVLAVGAVSAVVDAPIYRLRAPIAGLYTSATGPGEIVQRGQAIGLVRGPDGDVAPLESPCRCIVLEERGLQGQFYQPGEPLVVLIEADQPPRVRAQVRLDDAGRLDVGGRAGIRLPGRDGALAGRVERIDVTPARRGPGPAETLAPVAGDLVQVWIRPDEPLDLEALGTLASVRFLVLPSLPLP